MFIAGCGEIESDDITPTPTVDWRQRTLDRAPSSHNAASASVISATLTTPSLAQNGGWVTKADEGGVAARLDQDPAGVNGENGGGGFANATADAADISTAQVISPPFGLSDQDLENFNRIENIIGRLMATYLSDDFYDAKGYYPLPLDISEVVTEPGEAPETYYYVDQFGDYRLPGATNTGIMQSWQTLDERVHIFGGYHRFIGVHIRRSVSETQFLHDQAYDNSLKNVLLKLATEYYQALGYKFDDSKGTETRLEAPPHESLYYKTWSAQAPNPTPTPDNPDPYMSGYQGQLHVFIRIARLPYKAIGVVCVDPESEGVLDPPLPRYRLEYRPECEDVVRKAVFSARPSRWAYWRTLQ